MVEESLVEDATKIMIQREVGTVEIMSSLSVSLSRVRVRAPWGYITLASHYRLQAMKKRKRETEREREQQNIILGSIGLVIEQSIALEQRTLDTGFRLRS